jgi:hypothetical protein
MNRSGISSARLLLGLIAVAVALGIAGAISFFGYAKRAAPDAHRFAVAPFELYANGLDSWRLQVAGGLSTRLHQLPGWSAVPEAVVAERWQGKDRPEIAAVEMARRTAAGVALYGRVDSIPGVDSVRVHVSVIDVPTTVVTHTIELRVPRATPPEVVVDSLVPRIAALVKAQPASGDRSPNRQD